MTLRHWATATFLVLLGLLGWASPAGAHSFLVDTRPGQGERLSSSPEEVVFQFTEAVIADTVRVTLAGGGRETVEAGTPALESAGRVVRIPLHDSLDGVTVVSWHVVSAVDGHESAGELAFAVGPAGALPVGAGADSTAPAEVGWRWVFLAGLSLGAGALVASTAGEVSPARQSVLARLGLTVAAASPTVLYILSAPRGLSVGTVGLGLSGLFLATAALTVGTTRRFPALILTGAGIVAWAARSHTATIRGLVGVAVDAAHLAGAALWFGTLVLLVVDLWRARRAGDPLLAAARRYSRWALRAVIVLATAGLASALTVLTTLSELWTTAYGRVIILKVVLFAVALTVAAGGRWRALRANRVGLLRRLTTVEVVMVAGVMATSGFLAGMAPPALAETGESLLGPPPITGPVTRAAGLAGNMTLGVQAGDERVDLLVYNSSSGGIDDARLEATAILPDGTGVDLHPRPCGAGCFTQQLALPEGTTIFSIAVTSREWVDGGVQLSLDWPPPSLQPGLLDQVITVMHTVDRLTLTETVDSGPGAEATSTATLTGDAFMDLEVYAQGDIDQVSALPGGDDGIRLYLPGSRILIDVHLDPQGRILRERIVSPGHEITRHFTYP